MLDLDSLNYWSELNKPHLTLDDIKPVISLISENQAITTAIIGRSFLGKPIHSLTLGHGGLKVLAWTQMHGDEPTATAAVLDILQLLLSDSSALPLNAFCSMFTVKIIPMLNPDGAQAKTRINAQGIDINRDAIALQSPEGRVLREVVETFKPDIGLNLHDQCAYYSVGHSSQPATIAFLAPAFDTQKSINTPRKRAMQLIAGMRQTLEPFIQGCIARYNDDYSARCFGDNIADFGVSTILIESGAHKDDPNRQIARKMNTLCILQCFELLRSNTYQRFSEVAYFDIPENTKNGLSDLLIRGVSLNSPNSVQKFQADVALKRHNNADYEGYIDAIGDLSQVYGFTEIDADELTLNAGKPFILEHPITLDNEHYLALLKQGFTHFLGDSSLLNNLSSLPCLLLDSNQQHCLMPNNRAFMLLLKQQLPFLAILDNQLIELQSGAQYAES